MLQHKVFNSIIFLVLSSLPISNYAQGIKFERSTWAEVKAKAQKENKPIFVDAYTSWCGPCKWMEKNTFENVGVGKFFNKNFISFKLDMEKGEDPDFGKTYKVGVYPTLLYFSAEGELIHRTTGARDSMALLNVSKDALNPEKQLISYHKKYEKGERGKAFMKEYLIVLSSAGEKERAVFDQYWAKISTEEKISTDGLMLLTEASNNFYDYKDPIVMFFIDNQAGFKKAVSEDDFSHAYGDLDYFAIDKAAKEKDAKKQKAIINDLTQFLPQSKKELTAKVNFWKHRYIKPLDEKKKAAAYLKYTKISTDPYHLNLAAWNIYEDKKASQKELKLALKWANKSVAIGEFYFNLDTKGAVLYKMARYSEAKVAIEQSIVLAKKEGIKNIDATEKLLTKINAKLDQAPN